MGVGPADTIIHFNIDGEPSGTAGRLILITLLLLELTNFPVLVRYFDRKSLRVPGLIHAYQSAKIEPVKNADIIDKTVD